MNLGEVLAGIQQPDITLFITNSNKAIFCLESAEASVVVRGWAKLTVAASNTEWYASRSTLMACAHVEVRRLAVEVCCFCPPVCDMLAQLGLMRCQRAGAYPPRDGAEPGPHDRASDPTFDGRAGLQTHAG